jgi:flagellar assembly protein FliH
LSNGGILKSGWVVVDPANTRIIDSNARAEARLRELAMELAVQCGEEPDFAEGFTQGISAVEVSQLIRDGEGNVVGEDQGSGEMMMQPEENFPPPQPSQMQEELIAEAQAQIEQMREEAIAEIEQTKIQILEEARSQGYQEGFEQGQNDGFAQGHQDGLNSIAQEREQAQAEAEQMMAAMEDEYQRRIKELEPIFIDTLTGIYEHIFHVSLKNSRELIVYLIQNTMRNIETGSTYLIHVSKEDYPFASMQKRELIKGTNIALDNVELLEDVTLGKNECMIETGNGVFDCSLGTQLEALNEELRLLSYEP